MVKKVLIGSSLALIMALGLTACNPSPPPTAPSQSATTEIGENSDSAVLTAYEKAYEMGDTEKIAKLLSASSFSSDRPNKVLIPEGDSPEVNPVEEAGRWYIQAPIVNLTATQFFDSQFQVGDIPLENQASLVALAGDYSITIESPADIFNSETAQIIVTAGQDMDLFKALFPYGNDMPVFTPETEQKIVLAYSAAEGIPADQLMVESYTYQEAMKTVQIGGQGFMPANSLAYNDGTWSVIAQ